MPRSRSPGCPRVWLDRERGCSFCASSRASRPRRPHRGTERTRRNTDRVNRSRLIVSQWPSSKAARVFRALLRKGYTVKSQKGPLDARGKQGMLEMTMLPNYFGWGSAGASTSRNRARTERQKAEGRKQRVESRKEKERKCEVKSPLLWLRLCGWRKNLSEEGKHFRNAEGLLEEEGLAADGIFRAGVGEVAGHVDDGGFW